MYETLSIITITTSMHHVQDSILQTNCLLLHLSALHYRFWGVTIQEALSISLTGTWVFGLPLQAILANVPRVWWLVPELSCIL